MTDRTAVSPRASREMVGTAVAALLHGAWRRDPPPLDVSPGLARACVGELLRSGSAALVWHRARHAPANLRVALEPLRPEYERQRLRAAIYVRETAIVLAALRDAGVEPLLLKGWSAARVYAEPSLRPFGDLDLLVPGAARGWSEAVLRRLGGTHPHVDLHVALEDLPDRSYEDLLARSHAACFGGAEVRVLCPEDQLRHLCLHFIRHCASRPLWLCDIAAALETAPSDWRSRLGDDLVPASRVACALALACDLLGAEPPPPRAGDPGVPPSAPRWLRRAVVRQWGAPVSAARDLPLAWLLRRPGELLPALRRRWPNPIEATVHQGGRFDGAVRLPLQAREALVRGLRWVGRARDRGATA